MPDFDKSRLERLKRSLYSRDASAVPKEKRSAISETEVYDVKNSWGAPPSFDLPPNAMTKKNNSFFNKFLLASVVFFVAALGLAAFIFYGGFNSISSDNVDIKIVGPSSISSGQELDLSLVTVNGNRTGLENVNLFIDYPDGTQAAGGSGAALSHDQTNLGAIAAGGSKNYDISALLFGQKDQVETITLRLEYSVAGSNAVFSKTKTYDVSISSSPLLLDVSSPTEINSGQDVTLSIDVTSNSGATVSNAMVKIAYPYGFTYESSNMTPVSVSGNTIWMLGDLKNGDKKTLTVTGTLVGQNDEDRTFNVSVGEAGDPSATDFDTALATEQASVSISKSFFGLSVATSDNADNVETLGRDAPIIINWQNALPDQIINASVTAKLSGNVFDRTKVVPGNGGFYQSLSDSILWDKTTTDSLADISPDQSGALSFSVGSISAPAQTSGITNPHIDVAVEMIGNRTGSETGIVTSDQSMTVKFASDMELSAESYFSAGPFQNDGPIPPRADEETTYTVTWTISNTSNDLSNTAVSATLPLGVEWKGQISPSGEHVAYDDSQRTVLWTVGNVSAGTGFTFSPRSVSFQVGLTPSVTQAGQRLDLVQNILAVGTDTYTQTQLRATADNVTTHFSDPNFQINDDTVVK
jgi:hypothetical protein